MYYNQPALGSALDRSVANANLTKAQLKTFIEEKPENAISYAIVRNPKIVYRFIRQNYKDSFSPLIDGAESTYPVMNSMSDFLVRQYYNLPDVKRPHFIYNLLHSLPSKAEFLNWTTPTN